MTKKCEITGKLPMAGNSVSHAHNKKRKRFLPNLHWHKFWHPGQNRFVRLKLSTKAIRIIDKYGVEAVLDAKQNKTKLRRPAALEGGLESADKATAAESATGAETAAESATADGAPDETAAPAT